MRYDPQSAFIFSRTDWPALGAVHSPPADVPRFGMPLTVWETKALGAARRAAQGASLGSATETFAQPHPQHEHRGIILICTAWCHREGGWTIGLVQPDGQDSPWMLKADIEAQLRCACHCDWRPDCPGVVSDQPRPMPAPSPSPQGRPVAPVSAQVGERRERFRSRRQVVPEPVAQASTVVYAAQEKWHDQPEQYRGSLYADPAPVYADDALPYASSSGADWLAHLNAVTAEPEPVPVARAERRGFWGGLLTRREQPAPAVEAPQHYPTLAYAQSAETYLPPNYEQPQIIDAADYADWDDKNPALFDYPEALAAPVDVPQLPPPSDDYQLSSQAEIDSFIEVAYSYDTAPDPQPDPEPSPSQPPDKTQEVHS